MRRVGLAVLIALLLVTAATPAQAGWAPRRTFLGFINHARTERGLSRLVMKVSLRTMADAHSTRMAQRGYIFHSGCNCGEIVGVQGRGLGHPLARLFDAFMASPAHRSIILGRFNRAGIGVKGADGFIWLTGMFR